MKQEEITDELLRALKFFTGFNPLEISELLGKKSTFSKAVKGFKERKEKLYETAAHLNFMSFELDDHTDEMLKCYIGFKVDEEAYGSCDLLYMYYGDKRCDYISEFVKEIFQKYILRSSKAFLQF